MNNNHNISCINILNIKIQNITSSYLLEYLDGGILILDDSLGIDWRISTEHAILSEKDTKHEVLKDFESPFEY
jgi:dTDP-4-dehydrorhamnose 3,5-epimerase-like enzyme